MEDALEKKLSKCYQPDIIRELLQEDHEAAKKLIERTYRSGLFAGWKLFKKQKEDPKGQFAYRIILQLLDNKTFDLQAAASEANWKEDYVGEYAELSRILAMLFMVQQNRAFRIKLADFLKYFAIESAHHIRQESIENPVNSADDKVWIDGTDLRDWHQSLADYYGVQNLLDDQIAALFAKVKITTTIMGQYPDAVGPDMTAVAFALEKKGDAEQAIQYYQPILADFVTFLKEFEDLLQKDDFELKDEDKLTLNSLHVAVSRLIKLANYKDSENLIERINTVLAHQK